MKFVTRTTAPRAAWALEQAGVHPLLSRLYAARGVQQPDELDDQLGRLLPPSTLLHADAAARLLADALLQGQRVCVVADYDCDGATACAVALRGLTQLDAAVAQAQGRAPRPGHFSFLVPDRVADGYGLTPSIAQRVKASGADILMTVDNGIASLDGVQAAREQGLQVLVTDHHLPAQVNGEVVLPQDCVIVNPNQPGCPFESKALAGVGVVFYVLLALRAELRAREVITPQNQPKLDALLPLVALGTVADVVRLDANNRRLVAQGLKRIRAGALPPGLAALYAVAARQTAKANAFDLGFAVGPRLNAAGRLSDMTLGIACLLTDDPQRADELARALDGINRERKAIEGDMRDQALQLADELMDDTDTPPPALCLFDPDFHEGVVGIVASRIKDKLHRPTFVFALSQADGHEDELKGSGRSIPGFHLRDALDLVAKRCPGVLRRFGGHAMAAGCTIDADRLDEFEAALQQVAHEWLDAATLTRRLETDGPLDKAFRRLDVAELLQQPVWGQGFAPPVFAEEVEVVGQRLVADKHLALKLKHQGDPVDAMWFNRTEPLPPKATLAFRLEADEWQGQRRLRFLVEGVEG
ncbi:single-stranded-DNA-specific exonuclease RecJ [Hydrogenophaga soli]